MKRLSLYDVASIIIIFIFIILTIYRRSIFPIFVDMYYHLAVMLSFDYAGGIVLHDFLQYSPFGRPHIYPPFLHLLMLIPYKMGCSVLNIGKFFSAVLYPMTLLTLWFVVRELFSRKAAFFSLLFIISSWTFYESTAIVTASALSIVLSFWAYYFVYKRRFIAATIMLTFSLYSHLSMPHLLVMPLIIWAIFDAVYRRKIIYAVLVSYLLYTPWALHIFLNREHFHTLHFSASYSVDVVLLLFALVGAYVSLSSMRFKGKHYILPFAILVGMMPILFSYTQRFWFHSKIPLAVLAGLALSHLSIYLKNRSKNAFPVLAVSTLAITYLLLFHNVVYTSPQQHQPNEMIDGGINVKDTTLEWLLDSSSRMRPNLISPHTLQLMETIIATTSSDDIIAVKNGPFGCMITTFTGRATTNGMFNEIQPNVANLHKVPVKAYVFEGPIPVQFPNSDVYRFGKNTLIVRNNPLEVSKCSISSSAFNEIMALGIILFGFLLTIGDLIGFRRICDKFVK